MTESSDRPAKLCAPQCSALLVRSRLHALLDSACRASGAWIWGPPGAGKSALASSYLNAATDHSGWIRMDTSDADPSGFFHFLTLLARQEWGIHLTQPTREHLLDPEAFARRYFRDLFGAMPRRSCLVLDDYQVIDEAASLNKLIRIALEEAPSHVGILIISRDSPHAEFARLLISATLSQIDGEALRFTDDESQALATMRGITDQAVVSAAHRRANGWAAGLVMLLQLESRAMGQSTQSAMQGDGLLFRYFAKEVLERLTSSAQSFLLRTAFVPEISSEIARSLGAGQAELDMLEVLHSGQLFVTSAGEPPVYRWHTLFGEFLRSEAKRRLDSSQLVALLNETGDLLLAHCHPEEAIATYQMAGNWSEAAALIVQNAPRLLNQGRGRQVIEWIDNFPPEVLRQSVWMIFWLGMARTQVNARHGRLTLIEAHALFEAQGDIQGQTSACTGVLDSLLMDSDSLTELDPWLDRLQTLYFAPQPFLDVASEAKALTTTLGAHTRRHPDSRLSVFCASRLHALLGLGLDLNCEGEMVTALAHHHLILLAFDELRDLGPRIESLARVETIQSATRIRLLIAFAAKEWLTEGRRSEALTALERAQALANAHGPDILKSEVVLYRAALLALTGNPLEARAQLDRHSACRDLSRPVDTARMHLIRGIIQFARNDFDGASQYASLAVAVGTTTQIGALVFLARLLRARLLTEEGRWCDAEGELRQSPTYRGDKAPLDLDTSLLEAYAYVRSGSTERALSATQHGLGLARVRNIANLLLWCPRQVVPVLEFALDRNIEVEQTHRFIRAHHLAPSRREREQWPWPVRVRTFGSFDLQVDGQTQARGGRAQKRPLQLLQAVIALGAARVSFNRLIEFLWSESEGDDAERTLSVNLHRLRKLLTLDAALQVQDRQLSLNEDCCWTDAWAFEDVARRVIENQSADIVGDGYLALGWYAGPFLVGEGEEPWIYTARNRFANQFQRLIHRLALHHDSKGDYDKAIEVYESGLTRDDVNEGFYRGIMILHEKAGERSEGVRAYQRCRQALHKFRGVSPSIDTETIHRRLVR